MKKILLLLLFALPARIYAQAYTDVIRDWQQSLKESLLTGSHALKPTDTGYVRFYAPDKRYDVMATFVPVTGTRPFLMENKHGGIRKAVREYGYVYFNLMGGTETLIIYRFTNTDHPDANGGLFIPFTDRTNYNETFSGGRYLDVSTDSIRDNRIELDFNKSYNPHTAYEKGYPYIIPPVRNSLRIDIKAGEKIFGKDPGY